MEYGFNKELYKIQKDFIKDAKKVIENNQIGVFSSPTGTGKTMSLLCTAINFMKKGNDDLYFLLNSIVKTKIYYCSRTHSQLSQVINELKKNKYEYSTVIVGSRNIYCIHDKVKDIKDKDILNDTCKITIKNNECKYFNSSFYPHETLDIEDLKNLGKNKNFCPYYFAKNKSSECEIVLLPYNIIFTKEGRDSLNIDLTDKIVIIDEAHNIYDSVIQLNTAEISWQNLKIIQKFKGLSENLSLIIKKLFDYHKEMTIEKVSCVDEFVYASKISSFNMLDIHENIIEQKLAQKNDFPHVFEFAKFLKLLTFSDKDGIVIHNQHKLKFTPLNPKLYFEDFKLCKSIILAGGTMEPISQLKDVFPELKYFSYSSISTNFIALILSETNNKKAISFTFDARESIITDVLNTILALSNPIVSGGIVIFVPSFEVLRMIKNCKNVYNFRRKVYFEDDFSLKDFKALPGVLFAVSNGKLSEGINFSDEMCRLLIILGIPYPCKTIENGARIKYSKDYNLIAAMTSVNQSLGRALRHKDDYAALVLMDFRYNELKSKLSPWIQEKVKSVKFIDGFLEIGNFLKSRRNS